jgi:streptomycin 6-kinase
MSEEEDEDRRRRMIIRGAADSSSLTIEQRALLRSVAPESGPLPELDWLTRWQVRRLVARVAQP